MTARGRDGRDGGVLTREAGGEVGGIVGEGLEVVRRLDDGRGSGEGVRGERRVGRKREHCQKKKKEEGKRK